MTIQLNFPIIPEFHKLYRAIADGQVSYVTQFMEEHANSFTTLQSYTDSELSSLLIRATTPTFAAWTLRRDDCVAILDTLLTRFFMCGHHRVTITID